jgi:hypothetical protein
VNNNDKARKMSKDPQNMEIRRKIRILKKIYDSFADVRKFLSAGS